MEILSPQEKWWQVFNAPLVEASFQLADSQHDGDLVATRNVVPKYNKMKSCCHKKSVGEFSTRLLWRRVFNLPIPNTMEILLPQELWCRFPTRWNLVATRDVVPIPNTTEILSPQEMWKRVLNAPLVEASFQLAEFQHDGISLPQEKCWQVFNVPLVEASFSTCLLWRRVFNLPNSNKMESRCHGPKKMRERGLNVMPCCHRPTRRKTPTLLIACKAPLLRG